MTETTTRTGSRLMDAITDPGLFERNSQRIRTALTDDQAKSILDEPLTRLHTYADETPDGQEATLPARDCATIIAALDVSRPFRDAVICLSIDPDRVLAQLIRQAVDNHVTPGWTKPGQTR